MRVFLLLIALCLAQPTGPALAQAPPPNPVADSLTRVLPTLPQDTSRVRVLAQLCQLLRFDAVRSKQYAEEGLRLTKRLQLPQRSLSFLTTLAGVASLSEDLVTATRFYQHILRLTDNAPDSKSRRARGNALRGLANVVATQGDYPAASLAFRQSLALELADGPAGSRGATIAYSGLLNLYSNWLKRTTPPADSLVRRARFFANQVIRRAPALVAAGDVGTGSWLLASSWQSLADIAQAANQPDSARYYLQKSIGLFGQIGSLANVVALRQQLASLEVDQRRYAIAVPIARQAIREADSLALPQLQHSATVALAAAQAGLNDGQTAYRTLQQANVLLDTLQSTARREGLQRLQVSFDTERKESRIRDLTQKEKLQEAAAERQRQRLWTLGIVLALVAAGLSITAVLALRLRRSRALLATQNEQLARARVAQDRLYSLVAHDLRGPLTAFSGLTDMMRFYREQEDFAALDSLTDAVGQTTEQLTGLLDNLLHWAASQNDELPYQPQALAAPVLLAEVSALYGSAARARQVSLVHTAPANATLHADRNMTRTVLRNLVHNALKVSPAGSTITLGATTVRDPRSGVPAIRLTVTDTGPGLSPERLRTLLADDAGGATAPRNPDATAGTGLGLPLVRKLAQRQGGSFELLSEPGKGTTAVVTMPVAEQAVAVPA